MELPVEIEVMRREKSAEHFMNAILEQHANTEIVQSVFGKSIKFNMTDYRNYPKPTEETIIYCEEESKIDRFIRFFNEKEYGLATKVLENFYIVRRCDKNLYNADYHLVSLSDFD